MVGDTQSPQVGWIIMHGHHQNPDEEFACQSNPRATCALHASTPQSQTLAEVHLYFYPTTVDTTYSGNVQIGFFRSGGTSSGITTQIKVKPGAVGNQSVVGIVTDAPGQYMLTVNITATVPGSRPRHIEERVPVEVTSPGT